MSGKDSASPAAILAGLHSAQPAAAAAAAPAATKPVALADLRASFPDLCQMLVAEGIVQGAGAERERLAGIDAALLPGHEAIITSHKADPTKSPADAMAAVIAAERAGGSKVLEALKSDETKVAGLTSEASASGAGGKPQKATAATLAGAAQTYIAEQKAKGITVSAIAAVAYAESQHA